MKPVCTQPIHQEPINNTCMRASLCTTYTLGNALSVARLMDITATHMLLTLCSSLIYGDSLYARNQYHVSCI